MSEFDPIDEAVEAIAIFMGGTPGVTLLETVEHFFPRSPLPFTKAEFKLALNRMIYDQTLEMGADGRLQLTE